MSEQQHEAGRETDALVARVVFGFEVDQFQTGPKWGGVVNVDWFSRKPGSNAWEGKRVPRYSTDIAAAMLVVERMWQGGLWCQMRNPFTRDDEYWCGFTPLGTTGWNGLPDYRASAPTLPLAICRAALAAVQS